MNEWINYISRAFIGKKRARTILNEAQHASESITDRLHDLAQKIGTDWIEQKYGNTPSPVFVCSAGWRSGSTLLQRMIMSKRSDVLVWGEPYDRSQILNRMMLQFNGFTADWPPDKFFYQDNEDALSQQWIANLYPGLQDFVTAHRAYFDNLFSSPALRLGFKNWGVKEVRFSIHNAKYLNFLYPCAKFVFLVRNPVSAYASYRPSAEWFQEWPDKPILTPFAFGENWANLSSGFLHGHRDVGGLLIRYEDLDVSESVARLTDYLGWEVCRSSELEKLGSSRNSESPPWIPKLDLFLLRRGLRGIEKQFGY